jgi:hypothetical protein
MSTLLTAKLRMYCMCTLSQGACVPARKCICSAKLSALAARACMWVVNALANTRLAALAVAVGAASSLASLLLLALLLMLLLLQVVDRSRRCSVYKAFAIVRQSRSPSFFHSFEQITAYGSCTSCNSEERTAYQHGFLG